MYEGQFAGGVREGLGVISVADGARFDGSFKDDHMWGPGELYELMSHS